MSDQATGLKRPLVFALAVSCALLLAAVLWSLTALSQSLSAQRQRILAQVGAQGSAIAAALAQTGYRDPSLEQGSIRPLEGGGPEALIVPRQVALSLGNRVLWSNPAGLDPPRVQAPPKETSAVERAGPLWVYAKTLGDGRLLLVTFESPGYDAQKKRLLSVGGVVLAAVALLAVFLSWLALRLSRSYRRLEGSLGEAGHLLASSSPPQAQPTFVGLFQQTVSELRKRTEELEELHRREKRRAEEVEGIAEAISANLEAGILRFDQEGRLAGVNAAARPLLGLPSVPRLGDRWEQLLGGRPEVLRVFQEAVEHRALAMRDEVQGGQGVLLQAAALPLFNLMHQLRGYILILRDQTQVYQMRKTLREREALTRLGEVAAGVAHEVRNALNTFSLNLKLLSEDHAGLAPDPRFQALTEESRKLELVVQGLLFFAKPLPLVREKILASQLLEEEAEVVRAGFKNVRAEVAVAPGLVFEGDREALARALRNLVRNAGEAISASAKGGLVRLSTERAGERVLLKVEDDGPGIPPGGRADLFTPFSSQKPGGTGLGLAIARKIAREHGGDLTFEASALGGAAFVMTLPAGEIRE